MHVPLSVPFSMFPRASLSRWAFAEPDNKYSVSLRSASGITAKASLRPRCIMICSFLAKSKYYFCLSRNSVALIAFIRYQILVNPCQAFIFFIGEVKSVLVFRVFKGEYVEGKYGSWHTI